MMVEDKVFVAAVTKAVAHEVDLLVDGYHDECGLWPHRRLMEGVKLLVSAYYFDQSKHHGQAQLVEVALLLTRMLADRQEPSGLFYGGDNVESAPDSAFTINDACDTLEVIRRREEHSGKTGIADLKAALGIIVDAAEPALVAGGIHTPNHRWEISAALARLHRRRNSVHTRDRALEWLGEGIDINADGTYSERSANYAAHVSNPSLTLLGDVLARRDLHDVVESNLDSTINLILPDGSVETVHSRRQDQNSVFSLAPYLVMYRRFSIERQRSDFAWAAQQALLEGIEGAATVLTEMLLMPALAQKLPEATAPPHRTSAWPAAELVIDSGPRRTLIVYGGSDYSSTGRVRSGLANNPTFLRMYAGSVILDAVRLSRTFFGHGPFRATEITAVPGGKALVLRESISANYYQPLLEQDWQADGRYTLGDDGRFFAAMSFPRRERTCVRLETEILVTPTYTGVRLDIDLKGPRAPWSLEFTFRGDGEITGGVTARSGGTRLPNGRGSYRVGETELQIESKDICDDGAPPVYSPGEDYEFLGGTDATSGKRLYITGHSPGRFSIMLNVVPWSASSLAC